VQCVALAVMRWAVNSEAGSEFRWGGHGEGLRRRRGDAAGV